MVIVVVTRTHHQNFCQLASIPSFIIAMMSRVDFVVGNTYRTIPLENAKLDRTGQYKKVHDWVVYVDVLGDEAQKDAIDYVTFGMGQTFQPEIFRKAYPAEIIADKDDSNNMVPRERRWRFQSRQQSYGGITISITLSGTDGNQKTLIHRLQLFGNGAEQVRDCIYVMNPCSRNFSRTLLPESLGFSLGGDVFHHGDEGFYDCITMMHSKEIDDQFSVSKSVLTRICVDARNMSCDDLLKMCQQFVKYEDAIDSIASMNIKEYCQDCPTSNKQAMQGNSNKSRSNKLVSCDTIEKLSSCMNPDRSNKRYKLYLKLNNGTCSCVEFCFGGVASMGSIFIGNLICFCLAFVNNSIGLKRPSPLSEDCTVAAQWRMLFQWVIKDRYLEKSLKNNCV